MWRFAAVVDDRCTLSWIKPRHQARLDSANISADISRVGRTLRTQVALYLDADKVEALDALARRTGETKQTLLRQAIDVLLADYEWIRKRSGGGNVHVLRRKRTP